ncbi:RimK family protein [Marivirga sp. S37H4]|uniref:RimK family protein n=1 Tax=Marivirga aurantiaca TaxID=2802615 RepID=A0A935C8E1_9BACT|nr:RimK family protein [Marivirga aurantiaca]MBK6265404.1 RimK family protein [Marivirga aurantiaca]
MRIIITVTNLKDWDFNIQGVEVITGKQYLTDSQYSKIKNARVFNLSRNYKYQSTGYYVSLLAAARKHKAVPSISTIQDMKSAAVIKILSTELEALIQKSLKDIKSDKFTLSVYFGKNLSKKYDALSGQLFNLFQSPFIRAHFSYANDKWFLQNIFPITAGDVPGEHKEFVEMATKKYFEAKRFSVPVRNTSGYDMAILWDPLEKTAPSSEKTLQKFIKAAAQKGIQAELITKDDYSELSSYDALFIRETTAVNHHTFRFAQRAKAEGLVVVDDPESIIKCSNKVYLAELLKMHQMDAPETIIIHKDNVNLAPDILGFPIILKQPDSAFSQGVSKAQNLAEYELKVASLLEKSDLIIGQQFLQTDFDWRVGVFNGEAIYACKYFMSKQHWQIVNWNKEGGGSYGKVETLPVEMAPQALIKMAEKLSKLIGDSLYGVDIKQKGQKFYVIEINDNPNIDTGIEDAILKDKLYLKMMDVFLERIQKSKQIIS